jgi:hypothetical protein
MGIRADIQISGNRSWQFMRPHPVEEDERAYHPALAERQDAADLIAAAKIVDSRFYD